jgi:serine/threonine protein phosphatase PrpC
VHAVFDGHSGATAATICRDYLPTLMRDWPIDATTELDSDAEQSAELATYLFSSLNSMLHSVASGCTATIAIQAGWLLTVANVGDSTCCFDDGQSVTELTVSDRLHINQRECHRLQRGTPSCLQSAPGPHLRSIVQEHAY